MTDEELNDWGFQFIDQLEEDIRNSGEEHLMTAWESGDFDVIIDHVRDEYNLSHEQQEWIEIALD